MSAPSQDIRTRPTEPEPTSATRPKATLPPGQRLLDRFPRFGTHLGQPAPAIPADPVIAIDGDAVAAAFELPVADLAGLPRREHTADFHCVAGWSAADVHWEGDPFATFFRTIVQPHLVPGA